MTTVYWNKANIFVNLEFFSGKYFKILPKVYFYKILSTQFLKNVQNVIDHE